MYFFYHEQRWRAIVTPRLPNRDGEGEVMEDDFGMDKMNDNQL